MTPDLMAAGAKALEAHRAKAARFVSDEPYFGQGVALYVEDITVSFDGFKALNALTLTINVGELRCIIGPNEIGRASCRERV